MKKNKKGIIYSTNPKYKFEYYEDENENLLEESKQTLKVFLNRHKAGKFTVSIKNYIANDNEYKKLAKLLKKKCGVGGSVKDKEIILQGNIRDKVIEILNKEGYKTIRVGG